MTTKKEIETATIALDHPAAAASSALAQADVKLSEPGYFTATLQVKALVGIGYALLALAEAVAGARRPTVKVSPEAEIAATLRQ
jgi:hypothetical protein